MKGFIVLHKDRAHGEKKPISLCASHISGFEENAVYFGSGNYAMVSETYEEIKTLIEKTQKKDDVSIQYVPYVPPQEPHSPFGTLVTCDTVTHSIGSVPDIGQTIITSTDTDKEDS